VPGLLKDVARHEKAESVIVIPGGLEEKSGTEAIVAEMRAALAASRASAWGGPVINGGNCLGIRSRARPLRHDVHPAAQDAAARGRPRRVAVISQSGAFAVSKASRLARLDPRLVTRRATRWT
jgi:acyl-CoA synthetase (NDP forming)